MRDYAQLRPRFWTQGTGRELRGQPHAQIVAMYLMSSPHSNLIGLYYLPLSYVAHETGLTPAMVLDAFARLEQAGFAAYDEASEYVWVKNMAREQVGSGFKKGDNRYVGAGRELERHRKAPFFNAFIDAYQDLFGLTNTRAPEAPSIPLRYPSEGQKKVFNDLANQDQDQDREQEQERECEGEQATTPATPSPNQPTKEPKKSKRTGCPMADDPAVDEWLLAHRLPALDSDDGREVEKFLNYHAGKGTLSARWVASWATWRGNWAKFGSQEPGPAERFCGPPGELPPLKVKPPPPVFTHEDPNVPMPDGDQMVALLEHFDSERERLKAS